MAAAIEADPGTGDHGGHRGAGNPLRGRRIRAAVREAARDALVNGRWDPIGELIEGVPQARALAGSLPYMAG